jgi:hypothetical protein
MTSCKLCPRAAAPGVKIWAGVPASSWDWDGVELWRSPISMSGTAVSPVSLAMLGEYWDFKS